MSENKIFWKAINIGKDIRMHLDSEENFKITTRTLKKMRIPFYTYAVEGEETSGIIVKKILNYKLYNGRTKV